MKFQVELQRDIVETITVVVPGNMAAGHTDAAAFALTRAPGLGGWLREQPEPAYVLTSTAMPEPQDETKGQDDTIPDWMLASVKRMRAAGCTVNIVIDGKQKIPVPEGHSEPCRGARDPLPEWLSSAIEDEAVPYVQALQQLRLFVETFAGEEWMLEAVRKRLWELMLRLELAEPKNS
jgi:hypothetical protein